MNSPCIMIPAYKPDSKMIDLIERLITAGFTNIIVVDDGSGPDFAPVFDAAAELGCAVLHHGINMGKGRAMKTGFNHGLVHDLFADGVITADADGQHTPEDVRKIADAMAASPDAMVLGIRNFTGDVPLKSRLGNGITRRLFCLIHGGDVRDTQTGLRGFPTEQIPMILGLPGERYEYEMNMLLAARPHDINIVQIPIDTIYIEGNRSSHFKAFQDSMRIYRLLIKFVASSLVSTAMDYLIFTMMNILFPGQLLGSVTVARAVSSVINYSINKNIVFKRKCSAKKALIRYYTLAGFIMLANYGLIILLNRVLNINLYLSKVIADILLYTISFFAQRELVYKK